MNKKERIKECQQGVSRYVCTDCADKYSQREPYEYPMTMYNNTCYICEEHKVIGPSRKLFGFYRMV